MGSTLTGSTVASTYQSLLKVTDNSSLTSTLKTVTDGSGVDSGMQISTTDINVAQTGGNFTVNTNKFTVAGSSGNTVVGGTLAATGDFSVNTNKFTVGASTGNIVAAGNATITGSATVSGNITTNGYVILNNAYGIQQNSAGGTNNFAGPCNFSNLVTFNGGIAFNSNVTLANNLTVNGTTTLNSVAALNGNITLGDSAADTLTVTATPTFSAPATFNGNVTIGSDGSDTLTINSALNANEVTLASGDFVLIQDVSDSNKIKKVLSSSVGTTVTVKESELLEVPAAMNAASYNHNLGVKPTQYQAVFVCSEDNNGYVAGDEVDIALVFLVDYVTNVGPVTCCSYRSGFSIYCDSTHLYARRNRSVGGDGVFPTWQPMGGYVSGTNLLVMPSKNTGDLQLVSDQTEKWKIKFKAINI